MQLRPEWAWWVQGDKFGAGVQGPDNRDGLRVLNPAKVLYMVGDIDLYAADCGPRGALRTWHGTQENWQDPAGWARHGATHLARVYGYGVRDYVPVNEVWGLEGLGDQEDDYRWMGHIWTPAFLDALRDELHARGLPLYPEPDGVRVWLYGPAPGHNYEDGFVGLRHLADAFRDPRVFGSVEHYYWPLSSGFFGDPDFDYNGPGRLLKVRAKMLELGIDKSVWVSEFNRKTNRANPADIQLYVNQIKRFLWWLNSLDFVVCGTNFLFNSTDESFVDLTLTRMPGAVEALSDGWDRQSEGEWAVPPVPATPQFRLGFAAYAAGRDWTPLEWARPDYAGNDYQRFANALGSIGMLRWDKEANRIDVFWEE